MSTKNKTKRGVYYNANRSPKGCKHTITVRIDPQKPDCLECGRGDPGIWKCVDCGEVVT